MLMEIALPKMGDLLVMMMAMISPSGREVPPAESLRRRAKVLLPKFRLETAALRPKSSLLIFFPGQNPPDSRRWAPEGFQGAHKPHGRTQGVGRALDPRGHLVASLTSTTSLMYCVCSKNNSPEGFIQFGLRLIFLFCETLK